MWQGKSAVDQIVRDHLVRNDGMFPFYRQAIANLSGNVAEAAESVAAHFRVQYDLWSACPETAVAVSHTAFRELRNRLAS